jgi:hypothetical protein
MEDANAGVVGVAIDSKDGTQPWYFTFGWWSGVELILVFIIAGAVCGGFCLIGMRIRRRAKKLDGSPLAASAQNQALEASPL